MLLPPPSLPFPLQEAEEFAEQDKAVKARIDAKNQLETYAYNIKSTVEDKAKDKVRDSTRCNVNCEHGGFLPLLLL
jgi:molecular chaperone DnaK (HSP70)